MIARIWHGWTLPRMLIGTRLFSERKFFLGFRSSTSRASAGSRSGAGKSSNAKRVIDELLADSQDRYVSPLDIALIYGAMNDRDKVFEWLEKAYLERAPWLFELNVTPEFDPIRDDPRFADLVNRVASAGK